MWLVLLMGVPLGVALSSSADPTFSKIADWTEGRLIPLYFLVGCGVVAAALVARRLGRGQPAGGAALMAAFAVVIVGLGVAADQNTGHFPTGLPEERSLEDLTAIHPHRAIAGLWPFFIDVGKIVRGVVYVPDETWVEHFAHVSEVDVEIDPDYDPSISSEDPRLREEWLLDQPIHRAGNQHFLVIGRGVDYRLYETPEHHVLLPEDEPDAAG